MSHTNSKTRFRWLALFMAIVVAAVIGGCGNNSKSGGDTKSLKIGYLNVMDDAQALLAYDGGYYKQHGLDVQLVEFKSGTDLIKALAGGQLDAGVLGFTNALTWASKGADLKVVGGAQMGFHSILVNKDSGIKSVADLKGKKLASQKEGSTADTVLRGVTLAEANLTAKDLEIVTSEPANAIQALQAKKVDAAFVFEPFDKIAQKQFGAQSIYEIGKVWPFPCMVVITSGEALKKDEDAINRMLDAQKEAIEVLQKDPQKAAETITKRFIEGDSLDTPNGKVKSTDIIKEAIASQTFTWEINDDQVKRMQEIADIMKKQGSLEKDVKVEEILDLSWQKSLKK